MKTRIFRTRHLRLGGAALLLASGMTLSGTAAHGHATTTIAFIVFNPDPFGMGISVPPSTTVPIAVTAQDSGHTPIPGATVYVTFKPATGGGSATVGTQRLGAKPKPFVADAHGVVTVTYTSPATTPTQGQDLIKAENGATAATSTVKVLDAYCYSPVTTITLSPRPIAIQGHLAAGATVPVVLSTFKSGGVPAANTVVYLLFDAGVGGGSATVGTTALTPKAVAFTTDGGGRITVTYTTPATLPPPGSGVVDRISASDAAEEACLTSDDSYKFA